MHLAATDASRKIQHIVVEAHLVVEIHCVGIQPVAG